MGEQDCSGPICVVVPRVIGVGECQAVIVDKLHLSYPATEIKRTTKEVEVERALIRNGKVLVDGLVTTNVEYQTTFNLVASDEFHVHFQCCLDVENARGGDTFRTDRLEIVVEEDRLRRSCDDDDDPEAPAPPATPPELPGPHRVGLNTPGAPGPNPGPAPDPGPHPSPDPPPPPPPPPPTGLRCIVQKMCVHLRGEVLRDTEVTLMPIQPSVCP